MMRYIAKCLAGKAALEETKESLKLVKSINMGMAEKIFSYRHSECMRKSQRTHHAKASQH